MRFQSKITLLCLCGNALLWISCNRDFEGIASANIAPDTHTVADTIIRSGDDRLESEVKLRWWGDDEDGFIVGYDFTFEPVISESALWFYTEKQDSTFILAPPLGEDSSDYVFHVRAIDNSDLADPTPARLVIPVKNSPPTVQLIQGLNTPLKSFPVLKFYWEGNDPDGIDNLEHYELYFNDTLSAVYILDNTVSNAIFEAQNPGATDLICNVYQNAATIPNSLGMLGLKSNAWNTLYIRAVDQSEAKINFIFSDSVFVKKVNSNILMVNGYTTTNETFYASNLINNGFSVFDTIQIFEQSGGAYTQKSADNITQGKVFDLFDVIIWFSNSADNSFSLAQKTTEAFFNSGGKVMMSVYISSSFDPLSNFLDFTPIASLVNAVDTTLILDLGAQLIPTDISYPVLEGTAIVGIVKPIILQIGATPLYNAQLTAKDNITLTFTPCTGPSIVIAKKTDFSGNTNFVISTLELNKLDGLLNINDFFHKILIDEFGL